MNSSQEEIQTSFTLAGTEGRKKIIIIKKNSLTAPSPTISPQDSTESTQPAELESLAYKNRKRAGHIRSTTTKVITVSSKLKDDNLKWLQCSVLPHLYFTSELSCLYTVNKVLGHMDCKISVLSATSRCTWLKILSFSA